MKWIAILALLIIISIAVDFISEQSNTIVAIAVVIITASLLGIYKILQPIIKQTIKQLKD